jgi:MFS family permease
VQAYVELFSHAPTRWPLVTSSLSRITPGMIILALVLLLEGVGYSYAAAGFVVAAHQAGVGLASPIQGKLADRFGQRRILLPDAVVYLAGTATLAWAAVAEAPVWVLLAVAGVTGAFYPPVTACARVLLSTAFPSGRLRETAFAVSGVAVELGFIVGPLVAVGVQQLVGAAWSVTVAGVLAFVGAVGYASTAAARAMPRRTSRPQRGGALRSHGVLLVAASLGLVAVVFGVFDIVIPAIGTEAGLPWLPALLIASVASGSALGALVYGARVWPGTVASRFRVLIASFACGLIAIPFTLDRLPLFAVALFLGGLFLGPTTITAFQLIDDLALPGTQTEAQSWTQTAIVAGVAAGAATTGVAVDAGGPARAFVVGGLAVAAAAAVVWLGRRALLTTHRGSHVEVAAAPVAAGDGTTLGETHTPERAADAPVVEHLAPVTTDLGAQQHEDDDVGRGTGG